MRHTKTTGTKSNYITEEVLDLKLDKWSQEIIKTISELFYSKFEENNIWWEENNSRWGENKKRWSEADKKFDLLLSGQAKILDKLEDLEIKTSIIAEEVKELHIVVVKHEKRIKTLESSKN